MAAQRRNRPDANAIRGTCAGCSSCVRNAANRLGQIGSVKLEVEEGELRSKMVIEAKHACKAYDREIVKDFSTRIIKGNKIGIVGPNGAGKTTLFIAADQASGT